jgi:hypothetical protein
MQFKKSILECEVNNLDEVKALLRTWEKVLLRFYWPKEPPQGLTEYHLVNITLDKRQGPEEVVLLQFMAPEQSYLDRLLEDLKVMGLDILVQEVVPGFLTRCRLKRKLD